MLERIRYYAPYAWRFTVTRDPGLLICGLAITDRCNLHCRGCHVSNNGAGDLSYGVARDIMQSAYSRGCRELYFTGGEPMLWCDGDLDLEDVVSVAREMGYFHIHVYTNGTLGLESSADLMWVSVDGLPDTYRTRRGDHFEQVEAAIRGRVHPRVAVIYTVDRFTAGGLEPFLRWVDRERSAGDWRDGLLPHAVLRQGRVVPGRCRAGGRHRRSAPDEVRRPAAHQLTRRPQSAGFGELAPADADRAGGRRRWGVVVLSRKRRGLPGLRLRGVHRDLAGAASAPERRPGDGEVPMSTAGTGLSRVDHASAAAPSGAVSGVGLRASAGRLGSPECGTDIPLRARSVLQELLPVLPLHEGSLRPLARRPLHRSSPVLSWTCGLRRQVPPR